MKKNVIIGLVITLILTCIANVIVEDVTGKGIIDNVKDWAESKIEEGIDHGMDILIYGEVQESEPESRPEINW